MPLTHDEQTAIIEHLALRLAEESCRRKQLERSEDYYEAWFKADRLARALQTENQFLREELDSVRSECGKR